MGLDMYIYAKGRVGMNYGNPGENKVEAEKNLERRRSIFPYVSESTSWHDMTVKTIVAYWRKANAVHQWFVTNVQDGKDECEPHKVTHEQLTELRDICQRILDTVNMGEGQPGVSEAPFFMEWTDYPDMTLDTDLASELLPTKSGFFFGGTEYDQWYVQDLRNTVEQLTGILGNYPADAFWTLKYCSSW